MALRLLVSTIKSFRGRCGFWNQSGDDEFEWDVVGFGSKSNRTGFESMVGSMLGSGGERRNRSLCCCRSIGFDNEQRHDIVQRNGMDDASRNKQSMDLRVLGARIGLILCSWLCFRNRKSRDDVAQWNRVDGKGQCR